MRKRQHVVPANVLAQEKQRRIYAEEPEPERLVLVKSSLGSDVRVKGKSGLMYNLAYPYLYIDERDLEGLVGMVEENSEASVSGDKGDIARNDSITDVVRDRSVRQRTSKSEHSRQGKGSASDGPSNNGEDGGVSARDNERQGTMGPEESGDILSANQQGSIRDI